MALAVLLAPLACAAVGARGSSTAYAYKLYRPDVTTSLVVDAAASTLQYNHDAAIALFDGRWIVLWNANALPIEGHAGQYNMMAVSRGPTHTFCSKRKMLLCFWSW